MVEYIKMSRKTRHDRLEAMNPSQSTVKTNRKPDRKARLSRLEAVMDVAESYAANEAERQDLRRYVVILEAVGDKLNLTFNPHASVADSQADPLHWIMQAWTSLGGEGCISLDSVDRAMIILH